MRRDPASLRQIEAAAPDRSTWLSANAGSGKTRVLTDRVARLLLNDVPAQNILCLTYTKAAASEMQNRLFQRLGGWAMLPDADLLAALDQLGIAPDGDPGRLRKARRLFAQAIETPGGLKIQTIHSFCAALLRRFPLEAGVSPDFQEMEDRNAQLLRSEVVEAMANGQHADLVTAMAGILTDESFDSLTAQIAGRRDLMAQPVAEEELEALLGLPGGLTVEALCSQAITAEDRALCQRLKAALATSDKSTDAKALELLAALPDDDLDALEVVEGLLLTGAGAKEPFTAKTGKFPTKDVQRAHPDILPALEDWMIRVEGARDHRLALAAKTKARILHDFAAAFLPAYARAKEARGWLDFDDLILKTRDLLTDPAVSAWVLWRIDGGIDHILVDEAQDTSPVQWQVVARLAQEFAAGQGARDDVLRTIFVVGDKKQSIYSFQGADPSEFDRMREDFANRLKEGPGLQSLGLEYSFRSASGILALVDKVFEGREKAGFTADQIHRAFKDAMPGRVDLWPHVPPVETEDEGQWFDPVDLPGQNHHQVVLARRTARAIQRMIEDRVPLPHENGHSGTYHARPVEPGDIMILVRGRTGIFPELIRACKDLGLPIAGADRLKVGAELAVRDLAALLSFLALPEDDLSLASALKSPLFGWDEQALFDLAHRRETSHLWPALDRRRVEFPQTVAVLDDLRSMADYLRPYDLIERILTRHRGRQKILGRLGEEAEDGIDALLGQALVYERTEVPSLTGFLVWMETDALEIKRQMDSASNRIRVMTVHGAKGLESPVVILPDAQFHQANNRDRLAVAENVVLWNTAKDNAPRALQAAKEEAARREREEEDRLLYVAMTRAEKWLIVGASGKLDKDGEDWFSRIGAAMGEMGATAREFEGGNGLRLETGDWAGLELRDVPRSDPVPPDRPDWAERPAPRPDAPERTLSPSSLGGAKALPGEAGLDEEAAKRRGTQVHLLLEHLPLLPQAEWPGAAERLLSHGPERAEAAEIALLLDEARRVLTRTATAPLFHEGALAEVPVTAALPEFGGRRIHGTIDRLIVGSDRILAVDFKTNAVVPHRAEDVPEGLLRQMGAYLAALRQIWPDRRVEVAILWTRDASLMPLPHDLIMAALQNTTLP